MFNHRTVDFEPFDSVPCDHNAIVCAVFGRWDDQSVAVLLAAVTECAFYEIVAGHTARNDLIISLKFVD